MTKLKTKLVSDCCSVKVVMNSKDPITQEIYDALKAQNPDMKFDGVCSKCGRTAIFMEEKSLENNRNKG